MSLGILLEYKLSKKRWIEYVKIKIKKILIIILCSVIIIMVYNLLPKYDTGIDINIKSNIKIIEIYINGEYYKIEGNEDKINIDKRSGFIAIKTENSNKIVSYINEESIFSNNKIIKINITNEKIKITSFFVKISKLIEDHINYDSVLEIIMKKK
jgi:hypothetical protein